MAKTVDENALIILDVLSKVTRGQQGTNMIPNKRIQELTNLDPEDINDAIAMLQDHGYVEWVRTMGNAPYIFHSAYLTPRGRYESQRLLAAKPVERTEQLIADKSEMLSQAPAPIGSPYGFTDQDWEIVSESKNRPNYLLVVFGFQFQSTHYNTEELKKNVQQMFEHAVQSYNSHRGAIPVKLDFRPLAAGYGEHLFNEIARDILSSDIAIFDTSDLNPNVMVEIGVALTWGSRVFAYKRSYLRKTSI